MALRISFSIATNQYVVGKVSVEVHFWRHSTTRGCASLVRASIVLWYRSPDVEISSRRFLQNLPTIIGKLLAKQDGGALREGIRGLSEALMETGV
jgi:hypothetical protein